MSSLCSRSRHKSANRPNSRCWISKTIQLGKAFPVALYQWFRIEYYLHNADTNLNLYPTYSERLYRQLRDGYDLKIPLRKLELQKNPGQQRGPRADSLLLQRGTL